MRVFLSSTSLDLGDYRTAVAAALARLGLEVVAMEAFSARPQEPSDACLTEVESCDLFVGVYAHRYGHILAGSNISITEAEFRHAKKRNKPIFCFLVDKDHPWPPKMIEAEPEKTRLETFKAEVSADFVIDSFTTPDDLASKVATSVGRYLQQRASFTAAARSQLCAVTYEFTGRDETLTRLHNKLMSQMKRKDTVAVVSIVGTSGVGKTALANALGWRVVQEFPDAQLFIELSAHSSEPRKLEQALQYAITSINPEAKPEGPTHLLRSEYLSVLHGKRALVILDDVKNDEQVEMLMPATGCAAIITSRQRFACCEADAIDVLSRESAIALLQRYRPTMEEAVAKELAELCGYLPIALSVVGGLLRKYQTKPASEFMTGLKSDRMRTLPRVKALFESSYEDLEPKHQLAWRMLSVIPVPFLKPTGNAVIGDSDAAFIDSLDELEARSLLTFDKQNARYYWHDLLREFAQAKLSFVERMQAGIRWGQTDEGQVQNIRVQMAAETQRNQAERWKILRETQSKIFQLQQNVTIDQAKSHDRMFEKWLDFIKS